MAECRKRQSQETDGEEDYAAKRHRAPPKLLQDDESEDLMALLSIDDNTVAELMNLLEIDTIGSKVRFIDDPYSLPVIFKSYSSYVTINGNEESCGSSFSDLESSVMVSVDMVGSNVGGLKGIGSGAWNGSESGARGGRENEVLRSEEVIEMDGCDLFDWDDDLLLRFFG